MVINIALDNRAKAAKILKHRRDHFAHAVGLLPGTKGQKIAGIQTVHLPKLEEEYPPRAHDIYETDAAHAIWKKHQKTTRFPDKRGTWKPFHKLDPNRLQYTVKADESVIIRDSDTQEIICAVIRNFSNSREKLLEWINSVIVENNETRKSVRVGRPSASSGYHLIFF